MNVGVVFFVFFGGVGVGGGGVGGVGGGGGWTTELFWNPWYYYWDIVKENDHHIWMSKIDT